MEEVVVKIDNVYKKFPGVWALRGVSMQIFKGRCYGLLGPNGSGKSTLFKLIAGLCRITKGRIEIFGKPPGYGAKRKIAYLPETDNVYSWMKIEDAFRFYGRIYPAWSQEIAENVADFLKIPRGRKFSSMSRGYRARLKLVLLFASGADVLLLDDPFSGIDPASRERITGALYEFWKPERQTLFISTHIIHEIEPIFDYVYFLSKGKIVLEGETDLLRKKYAKSMDEMAREVL